MSTSIRRLLVVQAILFLMTGLASCQQKPLSLKTDAVTKLAIHYLNANMPDSLYQLTDERFRKHMTSQMFISIYKEKISGLLPFTNVTFITNSDSVSVYKIDGKIPLTCYISLDNQNKLKKFDFVPYQEELKAVSMSTSEKETDALAHKVLNLLARKQADSAYLFAGDEFKKQLNVTQWRNISGDISTIIPLFTPIFLRSDKGINIYSMKPYKFLFGALDKDGKFNAMAFQPYTESAVKTEKASTDNKLITKLDSAVQKVASQYIQTKGNVGLSIGVFYQGQSYFYNYGERKKGSKELPNQNTIYDIGSITKTFTSTLLAIAVNQGKVTLETSITNFLPDSVAKNPDLKKITFKELANHTSGLPRDIGNFSHTETDVNQPFGNYGTREMFSFLKHFKQTRQPGIKYEYSNFNYGLLGILLEKISHQPYQELIKQYVTIPLKMNETMMSVDTLKFSNVAQGYNELFQPTPFIKALAFQSAGGIKSSAFDLLTYAKAQLLTADHILAAGLNLTHQITFNDKSYVVGLGWNYLPDDLNVLQHNGSTMGYHSFICIDLSRQVAIVILANNQSTDYAMGITLIKAIQVIKN